MKIPLIINRYKQAWEKHDLKLLRGIFTENAIYIEKADVVFRGIDEIVKYWEINSRKQEKVSFTPVSVAKIDRGWDIIWEAKFFRKDLSRWLLLRGEMKIILRGRKICHFSEQFTKKFLT